MAWIATDWNGEEWVYEAMPVRGGSIDAVDGRYWYADTGVFVELPRGSIKKLIGRDLTWEDEPVKLKEN